MNTFLNDISDVTAAGIVPLERNDFQLSLSLDLEHVLLEQDNTGPSNTSESACHHSIFLYCRTKVDKCPSHCPSEGYVIAVLRTI